MHVDPLGERLRGPAARDRPRARRCGSRHRPPFAARSGAARALVAMADDPGLMLARRARRRACAERRGPRLRTRRDDRCRRARVRTAGVRVRGHGSGMGVAVVSPDGSLAAAAEALALRRRRVRPARLPEPARGLSSLGDEARAEAFGERCTRALTAVGERVPRGVLSTDERSDLARWRDVVAFARASVVGRGPRGRRPPCPSPLRFRLLAGTSSRWPCPPLPPCKPRWHPSTVTSSQSARTTPVSPLLPTRADRRSARCRGPRSTARWTGAQSEPASLASPASKTELPSDGGPSSPRRQRGAAVLDRRTIGDAREVDLAHPDGSAAAGRWPAEAAARSHSGKQRTGLGVGQVAPASVNSVQITGSDASSPVAGCSRAASDSLPEPLLLQEAATISVGTAARPNIKPIRKRMCCVRYLALLGRGTLGRARWSAPAAESPDIPRESATA